MYVQRLLNTDGLIGNNISKSLSVGAEIPFILAGIETVDASANYSQTPGHFAGRGFYGTMKIFINTNGYVDNQLIVFDFYMIHGIVLGITWGALALLQIAAARWLKMYHKASMWVHRISGFIIFLATFIMAMLTFKNDDWEIKSGYHPAIGLTIVITMSLLTIGGITARTVLEKSKWNTILALRIKLGHKIFGLLVIFLA
jgi:glucan phosphoethanolaminetransferase (alkaline phosphatase superfamily)